MVINIVFFNLFIINVKIYQSLLINNIIINHEKDKINDNTLKIER